MTKNTYRTAQGKTLDMGALILQNEGVRAVGNMQVNARGDRLDADNKSIQSRRAQVSHKYNRQIARPDTVHSKEPTVNAAKPDIPPTPEDFDDQFEKPQQQPAAPATGLAAAMNRVKSPGETK
jgi:hypothetical protein